MFNTFPTRIKNVHSQTKPSHQHTISTTIKEKFKPIKQNSLDENNNNTNSNSNSSKASLINTIQNDIFNSLNYLKTIIDKDKYEIIPDSLQLLLESVIQLYNYIAINSQQQQIKFYINLNLAKLIHLFDIDFSLNFNSIDLKIHSKILIENLIKFIKNSNFNNNPNGVIVNEDFDLKRKLSDSNLLDYMVLSEDLLGDSSDTSLNINDKSKASIKESTSRYVDEYMKKFQPSEQTSKPNLSRKYSLHDLNGHLINLTKTQSFSNMCVATNIEFINECKLFQQRRTSNESLKTTTTIETEATFPIRQHHTSTPELTPPSTPALTATNSSISIQSHVNSHKDVNVLNELCINDFLEYQTTEQLIASNNYYLYTNTQLLPTVPSALRGGSVDALIVLATSAEKKDFLYQEAFLTTYRTMIEPKCLIKKLLYRYNLFSSMRNDDKLKRKASKNSFALLVRVLDELGNDELSDEIIKIFQDFVFTLIINDQLQLARILRKNLLNKIETKKQECCVKIVKKPTLLNEKIFFEPLDKILSKHTYLLDFKSHDIAEQMTLVDMKLFSKIELFEILLWSTKQCEETSPNLVKFTEHFNNISYWTRTRILEQDNVRDREKYMEKFLKIMKHLRKVNNFNSYLALLSAVDSGPIQRLDWPKHIIDTIKEYSQLIDPKCGFKCLRETVALAEPPCIPHIGLILQDLTMLHVANSDRLQSGNCNFWKRWQQFTMLERLRFFRKCPYDYKENAKIRNFFNNFSNYLTEEEQYMLSEKIKPRIK